MSEEKKIDLQVVIRRKFAAQAYLLVDAEKGQWRVVNKLEAATKFTLTEAECYQSKHLSNVYEIGQWEIVTVKAVEVTGDVIDFQSMRSAVKYWEDELAKTHQNLKKAKERLAAYEQ
jgi:hypothetical protein